MALKIFNVLGREKQDFQPLVPGHVNMYVCGPTVYSDSHIGHAKTYVNFDMVVRYLRYSGLQVLYVQNITDKLWRPLRAATTPIWMPWA